MSFRDLYIAYQKRCAQEELDDLIARCKKVGFRCRDSGQSLLALTRAYGVVFVRSSYHGSYSLDVEGAFAALPVLQELQSS